MVNILIIQKYDGANLGLPIPNYTVNPHEGILGFNIRFVSNLLDHQCVAYAFINNNGKVDIYDDNTIQHRVRPEITGECCILIAKEWHTESFVKHAQGILMSDIDDSAIFNFLEEVIKSSDLGAVFYAFEAADNMDKIYGAYCESTVVQCLE